MRVAQTHSRHPPHSRSPHSHYPHSHSPHSVFPPKQCRHGSQCLSPSLFQMSGNQFQFFFF